MSFSTLLLVTVPQTLLTLSVEGPGPVRFGFPLPAEALVEGLRLRGKPGAVLQWRPLQRDPDPVTGRCWVELAIDGGRGRIEIATGGGGPHPARDGPAYHYTVVEEEPVPELRVRTERWEWRSGDVDARTRTTFLRAASHPSGERFGAGEVLTEHGTEFTARWQRVTIPRRAWEAAGVLPLDRGMGRETRLQLVEAAHALRELPGLRGRGDYARSGDVVTNLEYDTAFALGRLGLVSQDVELLAKAHRAARHLIDRDLDAGTGLPFRHGPDHRVRRPEPGHAWLQGLLLMGGLSADDDLLFAARTIAGGLARTPPKGEGPGERARDFAWPLLGLETWLRFCDDKSCADAADRLGVAILARWDPLHRLFRFGEGEGRSTYTERTWITGGIVLPALRAHLLRRPQPRLERAVKAAAERIEEVVLGAVQGLPLRYRAASGRWFSVFRLREVPEVYMLLEGLTVGDRRRLLRRSWIRRALGRVPRLEDPDLATVFTMIGRCDWVLQ